MEIEEVFKLIPNEIDVKVHFDLIDAIAAYGHTSFMRGQQSSIRVYNITSIAHYDNEVNATIVEPLKHE